MSFFRPAGCDRRGRRSLLDHWYRLGDHSGPGGAAQGETGATAGSRQPRSLANSVSRPSKLVRI